MPWIKRGRTEQPPIDVLPGRALYTLVRPFGAGNGVCNSVLGAPFVGGSPGTNQVSTVSKLGQSIRLTSGYFSRSNPLTTGGYSFFLSFIPDSVAGAVGLWSMASTHNAEGPFALLQRNGADLRIFFGGTYKVTLAGVLKVGEVCNICVSMPSMVNGTIGYVWLAANGKIGVGTATTGASSKATEYLGSGYNGSATGWYGEFWSINQALEAQEVAAYSREPWQVFEPEQIWMPTASGILPDAASNSGYQAASSSYSWSHTNAGTYLSVDVSRLSAPGTTVTGITYNGDALTAIGTQASGTDAGNVSMWGLIAPDIGTYNIAVTLSGVAISTGTAVSYFGVHQTSPTEGFAGATAVNVGAADAEVTITSVADNCFVHAAVATTDGSVTAEQTTRNNVTGAGGSGANEDNGAAKTPAGAVTMSYTDVGAGMTWVMGGYALRPLAASGGSATVTPAGIQVTGAVGTPVATGAANSLPAGVQAAGSVGAPVATAAVTTTPDGVQASTSVGTPTATGAALALPDGAQTTASVGTPSAIGLGIALPAGLQVDSAVGTPTVTGAGTALPLGVGATASVGTPIVVTGIVALPDGVQAAGSVGACISTGAANVLPTGVEASASTGTPTATVAGTALPAGVQAFGSVSSLIATGASWTVPGGVQAIADVGTPSTVIGVVALPAGVQTAAAVGSLAATGAAITYPAGAQSISYVGQCYTPTGGAELYVYEIQEECRILTIQEECRILTV